VIDKGDLVLIRIINNGAFPVDQGDPGIRKSSVEILQMLLSGDGDGSCQLIRFFFDLFPHAGGSLVIDQENRHHIRSEQGNDNDQGYALLELGL
jgi:hypothetical protein